MQPSLDIGEAEAITLAAELGALLLIDEIDGRAAAAAAGIPFVGVLGVLARAKRERVKPTVGLPLVQPALHPENDCHRTTTGCFRKTAVARQTDLHGPSRVRSDRE